jgi:hypothetical protein
VHKTCARWQGAAWRQGPLRRWPALRRPLTTGTLQALPYGSGAGGGILGGGAGSSIAGDTARLAAAPAGAVGHTLGDKPAAGSGAGSVLGASAAAPVTPEKLTVVGDQVLPLPLPAVGTGRTAIA